MDGHAGQLATMRVESADDSLEREFENALRESSKLAFRVAYGVLRHRQDAEDVAQEALVKAHRCFRQIRQRDRFRPWLVRMTWRMAIDRRRSDLRRALREGTHAREHRPPAADESGVELDRAAALWRAIDSLPEKLRVVVVLASIEEQDLASVAALLRLPIGTVKSRLFYARTQLKEKLSCAPSPAKPTR